MSKSTETPLETISQARAILKATYRHRGNWQAVADYYGRFSKAAYWRVANEPGYQPPPGLCEHVLEQGPAPVLHQIPVYSDANVDVYYASGTGRVRLHNAMECETIPAIPCPTCGSLHQVGDCHGQAGEVVIVPAGARIVQPKPQSNRPRRERHRLDVSRYVRAGYSPRDLIEILDGQCQRSQQNHVGRE